MSSIPTWPSCLRHSHRSARRSADVSDGLNALLCVAAARRSGARVGDRKPDGRGLSPGAAQRRIAAAAGAGLRRSASPRQARTWRGAHARLRAAGALAVVHPTLPRGTPSSARRASRRSAGVPRSSAATHRRCARSLPVLHGAGWPEEAACLLRALRWLGGRSRRRVRVLCADTAAQHELLQRVLRPLPAPTRRATTHFDAPHTPPQPKKSAAGAAVAATAAGARRLHRAASRSGSRRRRRWRRRSPVARSLRPPRGHRPPRPPIVLLVVARAARGSCGGARSPPALPHDPLAPLAVGAGELPLLLWQDFEWDMDIGWLKTARDRMMAGAQVAEKLGAIYILRPTAWLRTLLGMASAFLCGDGEPDGILDTDAALGEHVELGSLSLPGVAIEGVPKRPGRRPASSPATMTTTCPPRRRGRRQRRRFGGDGQGDLPPSGERRRRRASRHRRTPAGARGHAGGGGRRRGRGGGGVGAA